MEISNSLKKVSRISTIILAFCSALAGLMFYLTYIHNYWKGDYTLSATVLSLIIAALIVFSLVYTIIQAVCGYYLKEKYIKHIYIHGLVSLIIAQIMYRLNGYLECSSHPFSSISECEMFGFLGILSSLLSAIVYVSIIAGITAIIKKSRKEIKNS